MEIITSSEDPKLSNDNQLIDDYIGDINKDKIAKKWQIDTMGKIIITYARSEKELDDQWAAFQRMRRGDRRESDWKSLEIYGFDNKTRYEEKKSRFLKNGNNYFSSTPHKEYIPDSTAVKEAAEDDKVYFKDIKYDDTAIKSAKLWNLDPIYIVVAPTKSLEELEKMWADFSSLPRDRRLISDGKSMEFFGVDNKTHYEFLKSKLLKYDIDDDLDSDKYISNTNISFIESLCNRIKNSKDMVQISEDICKLTSLKPKDLYENTLIQSTLNNILPMFNNDIYDISHMYDNIDLPFYSPIELRDLGVYSGLNNKFNILPDNEYLDNDIRTIDWFNNYEILFNGFISDNNKEYTVSWISRLNKLYSDYNYIKASGNTEKIRARKQSILELGWNPNIDFNVENRIKASRRISNILKEMYKNTNIIDVTECVNSYPSILNEAVFNRADIKPIYIVFLKSNTIFNKIVRQVTKGDYSHISIGFDHNLRTLYSYSLKNKGFGLESITKYEDIENMKVFCFFVKNDVYIKIRNHINHFIQNKGKTNYNIINLITIPMKIDYTSNLNMVCSSFVDSILKIADSDITKKTSSLVDPNEIYKKVQNRKTIYKIYDGKMEKYDGSKVKIFIQNLLDNIKQLKESVVIKESFKSIYENTLKPYIEVGITEASEFPVQFDEDGNLLIKKMNELDFEAEYSKSHRLLMLYEKNKDLQGIKYELCKLWFMNQILEREIHKDKKSNLQNIYKARAKILNDFNKYMNFIMREDPGFNFIKYYETTPFNDTKIKINNSTLKYTIKYIKDILKM